MSVSIVQRMWVGTWLAMETSVDPRPCRDERDVSATVPVVMSVVGEKAPSVPEAVVVV